jgi:hypothetical protein
MMSKSVVAGLACTVTLACAGQAGAAVYEITVQGSLTSQSATGSEPGFAVGDVLTMTTRFEASGPPTYYLDNLHARYIYYNPGDAPLFHLWPLPTTGTEFWRIDGDGFTWQSSDDYLDGLYGPNIFLDSGDHFRGVQGLLVRGGSATVPYLKLQGLDFTLTGGNGLYSNLSDPGAFKGSWDWGNAIVKVDGVLIPQGFVAVPEPSAWAMLIAGFGMIGALFRRRAPRARSAKVVPVSRSEFAATL